MKKYVCLAILILAIYLIAPHLNISLEDIDLLLAKANFVSESSPCSVLKILCVTRVSNNSISMTNGTGFVVDEQKNLIITNYHVVEGEALALTIISDNEAGFSGSIVAIDYFHDLAIIKGTYINDKFKACKLSNCSGNYGDQVFVIGYPGEEPKTTLKGEITEFNIVATDLVEASLAVRPGNSGSPVFNDKSEVIGIIVMGSFDGKTGQQIGGLFVPSQHIIELLNAWYASQSMLIFPFKEIPAFI